MKRKEKDNKGPLALVFTGLERKNKDDNELNSSLSWL